MNQKVYNSLFIYFFALLSFISATDISAQSITNSWINTNQPYVRIAVQEKGIQRVPFSKLTEANFPVSEPTKFHLYYRGTEISILSLNNNELVFYGEPNDGARDSLLFRPMSSRTNIYHSMYSKEGSYFLTVDSRSTSLAEKYSEATNTSLAPETYHLQKDVKFFIGQFSQSPAYIEPSLLESIFLDGKGWTDTLRVSGEASENNARWDFQLKNRVSVASVQPKIELLIYGRSNTGHSVQTLIGKTKTSLREVNSPLNFSLFTSRKTEFPLQETDINSDGKGVLGLRSKLNGVKDTYSLTYCNVIYPQSFDMTGQVTATFNLSPGKATLSRIQIPNAPASARVFDLTDKLHPKEITGSFNNNTLELTVRRKTDQALTLFVTTEIKDLAANKISNIKFTSYIPQNYNYFIVTNTALLTAAQAYGNYRASEAGGNYKPLVVDVKDIYNQFNYGEPSPLAIRKFVEFMLSDGNVNKNLLLIGKSTSYASLIEKTLKELPGDVPTVGYPGADILLVDGLAGSPKDVPAIPVGRLSALTAEEVNHYLDKIKAYEQDYTNGAWRKKVLHVSGGKSVSELTMLKNALSDLSPEVIADGGSVEAVVKQTLIEVEKVNISPQVNSGIGLLTYFGHGSPTVTDLDMGYASDPQNGFNNKDKYPLMYFNGCGVGDIFASWSNTLALDWLFAKEKGAIGVISNSHYSYYSSTKKYLDVLYSDLFDSKSPVKTIGQVQQETAKTITTSNPSLYDITNIHQSILMGDPVLKIFRYESPDYSVKNSELFIKSKNQAISLAKTDSIIFGAVISNLGRFDEQQKIPVNIRLQYSNGQELVKKVTINSMIGEYTLQIPFVNSNVLSKIEITLDSDNLLTETTKANNKAELLIDWDAVKELSTYPKEFFADLLAPRLSVSFDDRIIKNADIVAPNAVINISLTDENLVNADNSSVSIYLKPCNNDDCSFQKIADDKVTIQGTSEKIIEANYQLSNLEPGIYELLVVGKDSKGNVSNYQISFKVSTETRGLKVIASPNPAIDYVKFSADSYDINNQLDKIRYLIYTSSGILVEDNDVISVKAGINEWYWFPKTSSGNYVYKIIFTSKDREEIVSGKIVLLK
ncbi:putative type IX secretion system sortase PorU2 [Dyadobacter diqingensis]|uniref:putative type IX secretion system sortase PorU2 n=1 Tax=Dyadobacter diqingensis TaxID=2938121 RepID=UPI0020C19661|nr:C25 family cysteine peptidase [Dyadobacter diqingensis]